MDNIDRGLQDAFANFINHVRGLKIPEFQTREERSAYIRKQILIVKKSRKESRRKEAREEVFLLILQLIPSIIRKYVPAQMPKEEYITEAFLLINQCIDAYDPDFVSPTTGRHIEFATYYAASLRFVLRSSDIVEDISVPFHIPRRATDFIPILIQTWSILYMETGQEPDRETVYKYICSRLKRPPGWDMFCGLWDVYIYLEYRNLDESSTFDTQGEDSLQTRVYDPKELIPDPDSDVEEAMLHVMDKNFLRHVFDTAKLKKNERQVMIWLFGLDGKSYTELQIAGKLSMHVSEIYKLQKSALRKLRHPRVVNKLKDVSATIWR